MLQGLLPTPQAGFCGLTAPGNAAHTSLPPLHCPIPPFPWKQLSGKNFIFCFFAISLYLPCSPQGRLSPRILLPSLIASLKSKCNITPGSFWNNFLSCCNPVHLLLLPPLISPTVHRFSFCCVNTLALSAKQRLGENVHNWVPFLPFVSTDFAFHAAPSAPNLG